MKLSNYFLPVLKETPADAEIISHKFMLRAGMISQSSSGIYSWLPLGLKVLKKIENPCFNQCFASEMVPQALFLFLYFGFESQTLAILPKIAKICKNDF